MEAVVDSKVSVRSEPVGKAPPPEMSPLSIRASRDGILSDGNQQVLANSVATGAFARTRVAPVFDVQDVSVDSPNRCSRSSEATGRRGIQSFLITLALLGAFGFGWLLEASFDVRFGKENELTASIAIASIVEKIIAVESDNIPSTKNSRSSASGPGQFTDETWLELIRAYRPDLIPGRSKPDLLELRLEPKLAREITTRLVERNTAMLRRLGLPVTAGTVYLAHFAGGAGAVAILSAPESADAALVMAGADATGRTKREQLIKANPFLEHLTVADLTVWADRRMGSGPSRSLTTPFM